MSIRGFIGEFRPSQQKLTTSIIFRSFVRPARTGQEWENRHCAGLTATAYTSWSTDRSIAEAAARACSEGNDLSGDIKIFRVRIDSLDPERVIEGRPDEDEYLIQGDVEDVMYSHNATDEEDE